MAKNMNFITFAKNYGKVKVRPYNMGGNSWTALLCQDSEGNETFIAPPKETNKVIDQKGNVLVDFTKPAAEIAKAISEHKADLVVLIGNKNWDDPEEEVIPTYTLAAKLEVEEIDVEI